MAYVSRTSEQATIFPANNLPSDSQVWGQNVEKRIFNLENNLSSAEINNVARDSQLLSNYNRLDFAVSSINGILEDLGVLNDNVFGAGGLEEAIANVTDVVIDPIDTTKINGLNLKAGTVLADNVVSSYVYAGSIAASQISGGTITGVTLRTANSGPRILLNQNDIQFYDDSGNYSGKIDAQGDGRTGTLNIDNGGGLSGIYFWNGGSELYCNGPFGVAAQQLISYGQFTVTGNAVVQQDLSVGGTLSAGTFSPSSVSASGNVTAGGNVYASGSNGAAGNLYGGTIQRPGLSGGGTTGASITDGGFLVRTSSSRRYKTEIAPLSIDLDDLYAVEPKTFKRTEEVEENPEAARVYPGFIAEELAGTSLDKFVFYSNDEEGNLRPEGIHYPELTAALLLAIKDLNARIEALEA